jgi:hypothetical protein
METEKCFIIATSKSKGKKYYVNTETGLSRWGLPIYDESTELKVEKKVSSWEVVTSVNVAPRRVYFTNPLERISQWNPPKVEHVEDEPLADGWKKRLTKCKNVYYVNEKENKSQWEIPKPTSKPSLSSARIPSVEPDYVHVEKPINQRPRALKWTANSCYLDSALFAFFAGPKKFIHEMLTMSLEDKTDRMILKDCNGKDWKTNLAHRKKIQDELKKIYESITRTGPKVEECTDLRTALANCPDAEEYHGVDFGDSGEFITYLTSLFPIEKNIIHVTTYLTNTIGIDLDQVLEYYPDTLKKEKTEKVSLVNVINPEKEELNDRLKFKLSDFLIEKLDTGKLEVGHEYIADNDIMYKRVITVRTVISSPYFIFSLKRLLESGGSMMTDIFVPDLDIQIGEQLFTLSGVVMHTGGCHYVAIANYNGKWWYYDDNPNGPPLLIDFESFQNFVSVSNLSPDLINPLTHGTQFYYTPIEYE